MFKDTMLVVFRSGGLHVNTDYIVGTHCKGTARAAQFKICGVCGTNMDCLHTNKSCIKNMF